MQIAAILSDLTSLRVCEHTAALALVTAKPKPQSSSSSSSSSQQQQQQPPRTSSSSFNEKEEVVEDDEDIDLRRATDLLDLHYGLKMKYVQQQQAGAGAGAGAGKDGDAGAGAGGGIRRERLGIEEDKEGLRQARSDVEEVLARLKKGVPGGAAA